MNEFSPFWRLLNDEVKITLDSQHPMCANTFLAYIAYQKKGNQLANEKDWSLAVSQNASDALLFSWETIASIIIVLSNKWMAIFLVHG